MPGQLNLSLENLGHLDGGAAGPMIDAEIQRAVTDLDAFGADEKRRRISIQVDMIYKDGDLSVSVACQAKLPPRETRKVHGSTRKERGQSRLLFDMAEESSEESA